jgi:hypothetical protein
LYFLSYLLFAAKKTTIGSDLGVITFIDTNFEELIRETLSKPDGEIINVDISFIQNLT